MPLRSWALPALHLLSLAFFFALDVSDLYVKTAWLGPLESGGFSALGTVTFEREPLVPAVNVSALARGDNVEFASGWPSLLANCDALYGGATTKTDLLLLARATNCMLGVPAKRFHANDLFLAASARVDAVAWTACKLLYFHRRPPLCQDNVVTALVDRYRFSDPVISPDAMADANSDAERELLDILELISKSYPLRSVVCFEGIQYGGTGAYPSPTLVGCASPNVFDAAFVGLHAPAFTALHADKAYLTVDALNVVGLEFVIRHNSKSSFNLHASDGGIVTLDHRTATNVSSFGHLYILLVVVDAALLVAHVRSAIETASVLLLPLVGTCQADDLARLTQDYSWTVLYRSLYRSPPIVVLTLLSGLLSWQFQLPNAILWTWDERALSSGKLYALLTSARVWMVVHCVLNRLWALAAVVSEPLAYAFAKRTFLSTSHVLAIGVSVAILNLQHIVSVGSRKYAFEGQRLWDDASFPGRTTYANSFNEELDYMLWTPAEVLGIVYAPLVAIVGEALLVAAGVIGARFLYGSVSRRRADSLLNHDGDSDACVPMVYQRLPLEELLRVPVRAQSLVRTTLALELVAQSQQLYLPPCVYLDFGVLLDNDIIRTRRGFWNVIHLRVDVAKYFSPAAGSGRSSVASVASVAAISTVGVRRETASPGSFTRPPTAPVSPLPRSLSSHAMLNAVVATDGVQPSSSGSNATANAHATDSASPSPGRRPLGETVGSPAARSMRRRKSTTELPSAEDAF